MKQFFSLMAVVFLIPGCGRAPRQIIAIPDVTRPVTLTLSPAPGRTKPINYLTLQIRGRINGHAELSFESVTNTVGPRFTIKHAGNYSNTNCIVRYIPRNVTSGTINIQYAFD